MNRIYARDCEIKSLGRDVTNEFLEENHNQGSAFFVVSYGLYYEDVLVQLMTFGKPRFNKYYSWEIIRDCTKKDTQVIGGASKIWKHFLDENNVRSCIVYSYPHEGDFTNKYVDYCDFKNIKKAKPSKKIYFEGVWNGEQKRIDKSILERHGVDRLLKGSFGQDRTNEQILLDLGFEKKYEDGLSPQVDSYFPSGIVYKTTDLDTGKFYIGETFKEEDFKAGRYNGSGGMWSNYFNKYKKDHRFKREILRSNFLSPKDLYEAEREEILKYCFECEDGHYKVDRSTGCMNNKTTCQPDQPICLECGTFSNSHKKTCSLYKSPTPCPECGGVYGHRKGCSKYVVGKTCSECGGIDNRHKKSCSKYKTSPNCPECGGIEGRHRKGCSKYKEGRTCPECGGKNNSHKKGCSNYVEIPPCPECGGLNGQHKKGCSKYVETICPECGGKGSHFKTCSHYNPPTDCPECGAKWGHHLSTCSQFKKSKACPICGSLTTHKKDCPHYKVKVCPECGGKLGRHFKTCSQYKPQSICPICGKHNGHHTQDCPNNSRVCPECGSKSNVHFKWCSKYKFKNNDKICPECGGKGGKHKSGCPQKKIIICPECGGKNGRHFKTCSKYDIDKKMKICEECGGKNGHHKKSCSQHK